MVIDGNTCQYVDLTMNFLMIVEEKFTFSSYTKGVIVDTKWIRIDLVHFYYTFASYKMYSYRREKKSPQLFLVHL